MVDIKKLMHRLTHESPIEENSVNIKLSMEELVTIISALAIYKSVNGIIEVLEVAKRIEKHGYSD